MTEPRTLTELDYTVVIPTAGRDNLAALLRDLDGAKGPPPTEVIVVDDRDSGAALDLPHLALPVRVLASGGGGPAAARNTGWRAAATELIAFLDDDVSITAEWPRRLVKDVSDLTADCAGSQARLDVPLPERPLTDNERDAAGLMRAWWITADMAYRRSVLAEVGGFDKRFPRAYREDSDLALRIRRAGYRIERGERVTHHPVRSEVLLTSVRAQRGNADDAVMRHKYGTQWRDLAGAGPGRFGGHVRATAAFAVAALSGVAGRPRAALTASAVWAALTAGFAVKRILPGPRTPREIATMALTSALIPPVACWHRLRGELTVLRANNGGPRTAVLLDRDDTLIEDGPYLADPDGVRPLDGVAATLRRLRDAGVPVGVVSNQSGLARGLLTERQLAAVNARVDALLGPFDTWQVCVHGPDDGCTCRKPRAGLVHRAADVLGVDPAQCVVIGDTEADLRAADAAGARGVLVPSPRTKSAEVLRARHEERLAPDLDAAIRLAGVS
ncbi:MAG: HAD-IIIA family hydrolase [Actinophytocola sp.]|nr:HAD-IIIA family hydrolase [Actinophytocola sp.]